MCSFENVPSACVLQYGAVVFLRSVASVSSFKGLVQSHPVLINEGPVLEMLDVVRNAQYFKPPPRFHILILLLNNGFFFFLNWGTWYDLHNFYSHLSRMPSY